jgi:hypothetical protein
LIRAIYTQFVTPSSELIKYTKGVIFLDIKRMLDGRRIAALGRILKNGIYALLNKILALYCIE